MIWYDYEYNIETGTTNSDWFKYNIKIKTVEIENGITSIGEGAFFWCIILTNITIPDSVTTIGKYAFGRCGSLTNITIPESVTSIGESIFHCCSPLKEIKIHKSGRKNMRNWDKDWKGYNCYAKIVYI